MNDLTTVDRSFPFQLGAVGDMPFALSMDHLSVHMAVLGGSGTGKSKFLELLIRRLLDYGEGGMLVDPHGDLADNVLAYVAHRKMEGDESLERRIHHLHVSPHRCFSFDPYASLPLQGSVSRAEYTSRLRAVVDRMVQTFLRRVPSTDVEGMRRLRRWMRNVLTACGIATDRNNTHLGLDKAPVLLDPQHRDFPQYWSMVEGHLPADVHADFSKLIETKRPMDQERWVESSINLLKDVLSPLVSEIFAQRAPSIDFKKITENREFVIVDLRKSPYVSHDVKVTIGGLLIDEILNVKEVEESQKPEYQRTPFTLVVDEVGNFIGEDLKKALAETRKYRLPMVLAAQNMNSLARGDLELGEDVLSLCDSIACFRQKLKKDKDIVGDALFTGNLDFTPEYQEVQRQRGWIQVQMVKHSYGDSKSHGTGKGGARTQGTTWNRSASHTKAVSEGESLTDAIGTSLQHMESRGGVESEGKSSGQSFSPIIVDGEVVGMVPTVSDGESKAKSRHDGRSDGQSRSETHSSGYNRGLTLSDGTVVGEGGSETVGATWQDSDTVGTNHSVSYEISLLPNLVSEWVKTGRWEKGSVNDQYAMLTQQLHMLGMAQCFYSYRGQPAVPVQVAHVEEEWAELAKWEITQIIKRDVAAQHAYNFLPPQDAELLKEITGPALARSDGDEADDSAYDN